MYFSAARIFYGIILSPPVQILIIIGWSIIFGGWSFSLKNSLSSLPKYGGSSIFLLVHFLANMVFSLLLLRACGMLLETYHKRITSLGNYWAAIKRLHDHTGDFFLAIRSFRNDSLHVTTKFRIDSDDTPGASGISTRTIVEDKLLTISEAIKKHGLLVIMGGNIEDDFLGNKTNYSYIDSSNMDWFNNFEVLASYSKAIIIVPELTEGLNKEILYIINNGLIRKTIFFMAPSYIMFLDHVDGSIEYDTRVFRYDMIRSEFSHKGIFLPPYDPDGKLFILNDDCTTMVEAISLAGKDSIESITASFDKVVCSIKEKAPSLQNVLPRLVLRRDFTVPFKSSEDIPGFNYEFSKTKNGLLRTIATLFALLFFLHYLYWLMQKYL